MKKFIIIVTATLALLLNVYHAHAQTGSNPILTIDHHHNSCAVYVDLDYWELLGELEISDHDMAAREVGIEVMNFPGTWLYEVGVVVTIEVFEDYSGPITIERDYFAENQFDPELFLFRTNQYTKEVNLVATDPNNNQVTWHVGQYYKQSGVWDGVPGNYLNTSIDIRLITDVFSRVKIDLVRVKKWDDGGPCSSH